MRSLPYVDAAALTGLVSWRRAQDALASALLAGLDPAAGLPRVSVPTTAGELLLMPAETADAVGFKLLSLAPGNPALGHPRIQGLYVLFDAATLSPQLLIDGSALTSLRTPAVSALAVDHLAVADARVLTVFGTGPQALGHVQAIASIRPIDRVRVVSRRPEAAAALCAAIRADGMGAEPGTDGSIGGADIVVCVTTSAVPVFDGDLLDDHACVVAIGSHQPGVRELDDRVFARAAHVVVEERVTALREAGDVIAAVEAGVLAATDLLTLTEILTGSIRRGLSVFKSVGMGWQDLVIAQAAHAAWSAESG